MDYNYQKLFLIQLSACIAETITFPIDYIKTLMQVNNKKVSFLSISKQLYKQPSLSIYDGLKPSLLRHCTYTMLKVNIYEELRNRYSDSNNISLITKMCMGGISGGIAQLITSPLDLLKVQYITQSKINKVKPNLYLTTKNIIDTNGILSLWKGVSPNVSRAILINLGQLTAYDHSKQILKNKYSIQEGLPLHLLSSISSGFVATLLSTPADVIKSRLMQKNTPYNNLCDCIIKTIKQEGIGTLYKGFFPIWMRLAPWQLIFWISYEKLRYISGMDGF